MELFFVKASQKMPPFFHSFLAQTVLQSDVFIRFMFFVASIFCLFFCLFVLFFSSMEQFRNQFVFQIMVFFCCLHGSFVSQVFFCKNTIVHTCICIRGLQAAAAAATELVPSPKLSINSFSSQYNSSYGTNKDDNVLQAVSQTYWCVPVI